MGHKISRPIKMMTYSISSSILIKNQQEGKDSNADFSAIWWCNTATGVLVHSRGWCVFQRIYLLRKLATFGHFRSKSAISNRFFGQNYKKYLSISWKLLNLFFLRNSRFSSQLNSTDSSIIFFSKIAVFSRNFLFFSVEFSKFLWKKLQYNFPYLPRPR